jgi:hypothetical protein
MPRTTTFTTVTPLPAGITRKSVMEMYEDHMAMIDLNPLVVERFKCRPPSYAVADEYFAAWYTIKGRYSSLVQHDTATYDSTDKVSYLPGGLAQGSVSYHACFHDTPEGLETHVYAPLGLDIRGKWSVGGSLPGERKPQTPTEKGIKTPRHGLYIREDVTMTCSSLLMSFVKRTFKDSHASLVEKLVDRAHLLESNFANERLRALRKVEPGERMAIGDIFIAPPPDYRPWGYLSPLPPSPSHSPLPSPHPHHNSAPTSSKLQRTNTNPASHYSTPAEKSHSRCHSDPIASPGFSSASTLVSESDRPPTPPKDAAFKFALDYPISAPTTALAPTAASTPTPVPSQPNLYLLPSTTYEAGRPDRLISLHPAGTHTRNASAVTVDAPRISYTPEERPISFTFTNTSNFDTHSRTSRSANLNANLLDEIDDAIDQVFLYSVTSNASSDSTKTADTDILLPSTTYELPATTYEAPAKTYELPTTTYELPAPTSKLASAAYELPATAYELPATTYSPIKKKSSNNAFVLPATSYTPTPTPAPATLQPKAYDSSKTFSYDVAKKYENDIAKKYENDIAKKYENDIAKTYESDWAKQPVGKGLKAKAVAAQTVHKRKDSVVPWTDKELPPVPVDG